ncbi:hypothetical protein ACHAQH_001233 [Verticillium albo-atrum]
MFRPFRNRRQNASSNGPPPQPFRVIPQSQDVPRDNIDIWEPQDDEPPPPYTETPISSDAGIRYLHREQRGHVTVPQVEDTSESAFVPRLAHEYSVNTPASPPATTSTDARHFYGRINPAITDDFTPVISLDSQLGTVPGPSTDQAMTDAPQASVQRMFRYQKTSEDIMADFDPLAIASPHSVVGRTQLPPPPGVESTPRIQRGYSRIAASILDDLEGTPFSNADQGALGVQKTYENLALRAAMHQADNFIWCPGGCGSGQIHETGTEQPIVICLHCNSRSCFTHEVAWHDGLTCDEYDSLLADPENFRSHIEIENAAVEEEESRRRAQDAADRALVGRLAAAQEAEERARLEREKEARRKAAEAVEKARQAAARRKREDEQSVATMNRTTKKCPGCSWAIEKNSGCSHMTCTNSMCVAEFCWECLANHREIMLKDNSAHKRTCKFHPDNLNEEYMGEMDQDDIGGYGRGLVGEVDSDTDESDFED